MHMFTFGRIPQFTLPLKGYESLVLIQILASAQYYWPFSYSNSVECSNISLWFYLHIHDDWWNCTPLYVYGPFEYFLLWSALNNFCPFSIECYIYLLTCNISLYIMAISSLLDVSIVNSFSHFVDCLFTVSWNLSRNRNC